MSELMTSLASEMGDEPPDEGDKLVRLQQLGARVRVLSARLEQLDAQAQDVRNERTRILGRDMVDLMAEARVSSLTVEGDRFEVADYYHASIKQDSPRYDEALDYLETHDAGDLIKYELVVLFPRDSQEEAAALTRYVRERYQAAEVELKRSVPWARLTSWLAELVRAVRTWDSPDPPPEVPPLDLVGATVARVVKVLPPEKPRKSRR